MFLYELVENSKENLKTDQLHSRRYFREIPLNHQWMVAELRLTDLLLNPWASGTRRCQSVAIQLPSAGDGQFSLKCSVK